MADGKFDDLLLAMAQKHKSIEDLSLSILSFFERRTDLFHVMERPNDRMGFMPGVAEKMVFKHFHFFQHKYLGRAQPHILKEAYGAPNAAPADAAGGQAALQDTPAVASTAPPGAAQAALAAEPVPRPLRGGEEGAGGRGSQEGAEGQGLPEGTRKMMRHISTWNGAVTDKYHWSQSLAEVTLEVEVEECRAKEIQVVCTATRLSIKCKGKTVLEGKLHEKVSTEDTMWHLDGGTQVVLSLEKQRQTWWKCVLEGDQEIDTTKVESTKTMDEYDGETQGAIRKIMFDQNQKVQGKPSSDQLRTAEIMKEAWNAPNSPFRGSEFDPTMLNLSGPVSEDFFEDVDKRRIEEARKAKVAAAGSASDGSGGGPAA